MNKYKVCVYAIAKNEEKNVENWYNSMKEADAVYVLDTGSTDNTVQKLRDLGAIVEQKIITPWRFDVARNESLKMVPEDTDIYVCTDIDETISPGWRKELEECWKEDTVQANYLYIYAKDKYGKPTLTFYFDKIHNKDFEWICPIHEVVSYIGKKERKVVLLPNVAITHHRDITKDRSSYKPLLEQAVIERPNDSRIARLLTREYVKDKEWEKVIIAGKHYLEIPTKERDVHNATIKRYIGRAYKRLGDYENSKKWYTEAIEQAKDFREPYIELGLVEEELYNYDRAIELFEKAASIKEKNLRVVGEVFAWNETVYKELAICYKNKGNFKKAYDNILLAEEINKDSPSIQKLKSDIVGILKMNKEL